MSVFWQHTPKFYTTTNIRSFWTVYHADLIVDPTNGYGGTPSISGSSASAFAIKMVPPPGGAVTGLGARLKAVAYPAAELIILGVVDDTGALLLSLTLRTDGKLALYTGAMASLLAVTTTAVPTGTQTRIGWKTTLGAGASGACEIQINGVVVGSGSGADPGLLAVAGIYVGAASGIHLSMKYGIDGGDLIPAYSLDGVPASNGNLDELDNDGDTTKEDLAAAGDQVTTGLGTVTSRVRVHGVTTVVVVKHGTGDGFFQPILTSGASEYAGDNQAVSNDIYRALEEFHGIDPDTGLPWVTTNIAASSVGGKAVS